MENKKLVHILLKDMGELEELISEIKSKGNFDFLEIEFLHTRAKGILQLLQMLNSFEPAIKARVEINETDKVINVIPLFKNKIEEIKDTVNSEEDKVEKYREEPAQNEEIYTEPEPEVIELPETRDVVETVEVPVIHAEKTVEVPVNSVHEKNNRDEIELEEEATIEPGQRLGDSFLKGKSINDLVEEHNNLDYKLSNRPVSSIQAAIGINDRFQYIRELFEGSSDKFSEAVTSLDTMNNINEAVIYLQQNFRWKKNETSLKFVNLVKRRFANE